MPSQFGRYQSGIEAATGNLVPAYGKMAEMTANSIAGFGQNLAAGIQKYQANNAEAEMINEEAQALGGQLQQFQSIFGNNQEYAPFAEQLGGYVDKLSKIPEMSLAQKRGALNGAKVAFSQIGTQLQMFNAMKTMNEENAMYNAQRQSADATTTVDDTVKTRASQFDPLKPYATQEVGFIDNLKKLQEKYPDAQIDIPSRLEEWRNNVSAQANELAKSNPLGLKVIDQVEAARKVDTATSPDVEGYSEAEQTIAKPAYTPTAEDLKALTAATGTKITADNITPELAASIEKVNAVQASAPVNSAVTTEQQKVALLKKTLGFALPSLGAIGQAVNQTVIPRMFKDNQNGVSSEQINQYRQPSVGDLVSTASNMGYPAYAALGLGANALMAGGTPVSSEQPVQPTQTTEQAQQVQAEQPTMPAQRPANVPTIAVPEMQVGTVPREVPLDEAQKKQKTLEIFSKILKYGVDENGKQIIAPQAERMYQSMQPTTPKVITLKDGQGNDYSVLETVDSKGKKSYKSISPVSSKGQSEGSLKLEKASTFGVVDPKTGQIGYEQPIQGLNVLVRGQGDFATTEKAEKFKELLASSAIVIKSMNRVKQIVKDDPYWAKTPFTVTKKEIISEQSKAIAMLQKSLGLDRLSDKDLKIIMERMPRGEDWFDATPEQTTFMANQIIKDTHNLIKSSGEVHNLEIVLPDSMESTTVEGEDFRSIDARNALMGIPAKR